MLVIGSNPIVSNPNALFVESTLKKLELLVVVDMFHSETARYAHFLLPTSSYLEDEGTMTNLEGRVVFRSAKRKPPGEAMHDWQILSALAKTLGVGQGFTFENSEEIFNELRLASKDGKADYFGITYDKIKQHQGVFWPCPNDSHGGTPRLFENGFFTNDKRANFLTHFQLPPKALNEIEYPLIFTTGRILDHYLTGVQTRKSTQLAQRTKEAFVEIHPVTALRFKINEGDLVTLSSKNGSTILKAKITDEIREDIVFSPIHWGDLQSVNRLFPPVFDENCMMPQFKQVAVKIESIYTTTIKEAFHSISN